MPIRTSYFSASTTYRRITLYEAACPSKLSICKTPMRRQRYPIRGGEVIVNGRTYRNPVAPTVVICFDGCDPRYIAHGFSAGLLPNISRIMSEGFYTIADAAMPTFTNPNNMSIVAGAPPKVHGIAGNYYLNKAIGREVPPTLSSRGLRVPASGWPPSRPRISSVKCLVLG